ncbi:Crp/Fnr family transcriptional regulator [Desertivirga brevis]|uniref:Crp/Fnr family transcriptional regulator n=1 Tax=Desertivirga brevis TaxID=2810310 RepID=UPI001A96055A|nr:Crp/Fnr family transcriptional regulator [Pedobacter sp. SYSU D00873]
MKECKNKCDLKSCFLCQLVLPDWLPAIEARKRNIELKKGQQVFKEGDPVIGIYFVNKGTIKVHKRWDSEKELIIRFSKPGDVIGYLGLGLDPTYPVTTTALQPSVVCFLDLQFLENTLNVNSKFTVALVRLMATDLQESHKSMRDLAHMSVKARIAKAFISMKNQFGLRTDGSINLDINKQDIAAYAGASYETFFKVVTELSSNKIVEFYGKSFTIQNEALLLEIIARG